MKDEFCFFFQILSYLLKPIKKIFLTVDDGLYEASGAQSIARSSDGFRCGSVPSRLSFDETKE